MNPAPKSPNRYLIAMRLPAALVVITGFLQLFHSLGLAGSDLAWGNVPRSFEHIVGIITFHLRHANWGHWAANAIPLFILPTVAGMLVPSATKQAWWIITLVSGTLLWLIGRQHIHIGASALVYGWFFFLVSLSFFHRSWVSIPALIISLGLFSGLLWVFQGGSSVSWEGHLSGALAGILAARMTRPKGHLSVKNGLPAV